MIDGNWVATMGTWSGSVASVAAFFRVDHRLKLQRKSFELERDEITENARKNREDKTARAALDPSTKPSTDLKSARNAKRRWAVGVGSRDSAAFTGVPWVANADVMNGSCHPVTDVHVIFAGELLRDEVGDQDDSEPINSDPSGIFHGTEESTRTFHRDALMSGENVHLRL
ncbi:hypothetical protein GCM10009628_27330 [Paeniglutamicibacter kerguelensis]